jgi:hypothetical protein
MLRNLRATFFRRLSARGREFWHIKHKIGFTLLAVPLYSNLIAITQNSQRPWIYPSRYLEIARIPVFDVRVVFLSSLFILSTFMLYLLLFRAARNTLTFIILFVIAHLVYYLLTTFMWITTVGITFLATSKTPVVGLTLIEHAVFMTAGIAFGIAAAEELFPLMRTKCKSVFGTSVDK